MSFDFDDGEPEAAVQHTEGRRVVYCAAALSSSSSPPEGPPLYLALLPLALRDLVDGLLRAEAWKTSARLAELPVGRYVLGGLDVERRVHLVMHRGEAALLHSLAGRKARLVGPHLTPADINHHVIAVLPPCGASEESRLLVETAESPAASSPALCAVASLAGDLISEPYAPYCPHQPHFGHWLLHRPSNGGPLDAVVRSLLRPEACYALTLPEATLIAGWSVCDVREPLLCVTLSRGRRAEDANYSNLYSLRTGWTQHDCLPPGAVLIEQLGIAVCVSTDAARVLALASPVSEVGRVAGPILFLGASVAQRRVWFYHEKRRLAHYLCLESGRVEELTLPGYNNCQLKSGPDCILQFTSRATYGRAPYLYHIGSGLGLVAPSSEQHAAICCHAGAFVLAVRAAGRRVAVYEVPPSPLPTAQTVPRPELRKFIGLTKETPLVGFLTPSGRGASSHPPALFSASEQTVYFIRAREASE